MHISFHQEFTGLLCAEEGEQTKTVTFNQGKVFLQEKFVWIYI
jgi:hypothetical protein